MLGIRSNRVENGTISHQEPSIASFPWLRTDIFQYKSKNKSKHRVESIDNQSIEVVSKPSSIILVIHADGPPPSYDHESHPWAYKLPASFSHRTVLPREEEGKEILPEYECTLEKSQFLLMKCEMNQGMKSKNRSWKYFYIVLVGTMIQGYANNPTNQKRPKSLWSYSMEGAQIRQAMDYVKYKHVTRLKLKNGSHFLIRHQTDKHMTEWISSLESSINISADIDHRKMPLISTQYRRRNRDRSHQDDGSARLDSLS